MSYLRPSCTLVSLIRGRSMEYPAMVKRFMKNITLYGVMKSETAPMMTTTQALMEVAIKRRMAR